jgi:hypothetical protein
MMTYGWMKKCTEEVGYLMMMDGCMDEEVRGSEIGNTMLMDGR